VKSISEPYFYGRIRVRGTVGSSLVTLRAPAPIRCGYASQSAIAAIATSRPAAAGKP
jgi:hypothetical protein